MYCLLLQEKSSLLGKFLSNSVLVSVGNHSYLLYLWHYPMLRLMMELRPIEHTPLMTLFMIMIAFVCTFFLAYIQAFLVNKIVNKKIR